MEFVMVPVPEELVHGVAQYLQWKAWTATTGVWDESAVTRLLGDLDEPARALLVHAAESAQETLVLTVRDAAQAAGCSEREVLGITVELNETVRLLGGPPFVLAPSLLDAQSETRPRAWKLDLGDDMARLVRAAAERRDDPRL
jgi:hypothetical protein